MEIAHNSSWTTGLFLVLLFLFLIRKLWDQAVSRKNIRNLKNHYHVHSVRRRVSIVVCHSRGFFYSRASRTAVVSPSL